MASGLVKRYAKGTDSDATDTLVAETVRSHPRPGSNSNGNLVFNWQSGGDVRHGFGDTPTALSKQQTPALFNGQGVRRLTPTECERLQGFPDGWTQLGATADSKRYAALGDAVTVNVAEWIGHQLLAHIRAEAVA